MRVFNEIKNHIKAALSAIGLGSAAYLYLLLTYYKFSLINVATFYISLDTNSSRYFKALSTDICNVCFHYRISSVDSPQKAKKTLLSNLFLSRKKGNIWSN